MKKILVVSVISFFACSVNAQINSARIARQLKALNTFARVMYVGWKPGDEDEQLLSFLSKQTHCDVAYLSLTRGEQMSNYAGYERSVDLGIIHAQELSAAAKTAGFEPMTTCAMDLGNYTSSKDVFNVWSSDTLMANLVWAIRYFRPDIIITPYNNKDSNGGTLLDSLITEANKRAADKDYNSIQLAGRFSFLDTASARQIFWDIPDSVNTDRSNCIPIYTNQINESSGLTYKEIAKQAYLCERSVFKNLDNLPLRKDTQYLQPLLSPAKNLFENIDTSWSRAGNNFQNKVDAVIQQFDFLRPEKSLNDLTDLYRQINESNVDKFWKKIKLQQLQNIILSCAGISVESFCNKPFGVITQNYDFTVQVKNNLSGIKISGININDSSYGIDTSLAAKNNYTFTKNFHITGNAYQPFWLNNPIDPEKQMYAIDDSMTDKLIDTACYSATVALNINNLTFFVKTPVVYHTFDRMNGDITEPFYTVEPVQVSLEPTVLLTNVTGDTKANKNTDIKLKFRALFNGSMLMIFQIQKIGEVSKKDKNSSVTSIPEFLYRSDSVVNFKYNDAFTIKIPFKDSIQKNESKAKLLVPNVLTNFSGDGEAYDSNIKEINYNYIPNVLYNYHDETSVVDDEIKTKGKRIAYLFGLPQDALNNALYQLGYKVDNVNLSDLQSDSLKHYDAVIIGNYFSEDDVDTNELKTAKFNLDSYVYNGGTLISFATGDEANILLPLQIETVAQNILQNASDFTLEQANDSTLFNYPNKVNIASVENRTGSLAYGFSEKYDNRFKPALLIKSRQNNYSVSPVLYAHHGSGISIYCNLDIPSQAMNAQPDAFKLLANFIAFVHHRNNGN